MVNTTIREKIIEMFLAKHIQTIRGINYQSIHTISFVYKIIEKRSFLVAEEMRKMTSEGFLIKLPKTIFSGPRGGQMFAPSKKFFKKFKVGYS